MKETKTNICQRLQLVDIEKKSIREYLEKNQDKFVGNVLDFGCGQQPYRDLVKGKYFGYDPLFNQKFFNNKFNTIFTTQVAQFFDDPYAEFKKLYNSLVDGGHLIVTYPTNWYEVDPKDNFRYTHWGMERMLKKIGFKIIDHTPRGYIEFEDFRMCIGYGITCKK